MTSSLPASVSSPKDLALLILDIKKYAKWFLQYYNASKSNVKYSSPQPEISKIASEIIIYWDNVKRKKVYEWGLKEFGFKMSIVDKRPALILKINKTI